MSECASHSWSSWSSWNYYGSGQDVTERFCRNCPATDASYRSHVHSYGTPFSDPYSPVGASTRIKVCSACQDVAAA